MKTGVEINSLINLKKGCLTGGRGGEGEREI